MASDSASPSLLVPIITRRKVAVPAQLLLLTRKRFVIKGKSIPVCTDFDDTLFPTPTMVEKRFTLRQSIAEPPLLGLVRKKIRLGVFTNSDITEIDRRFTDPLQEVLAAHDELHLMEQVRIYANGGAIRCIYDAKGQLNEAGREEYRRQFVIPGEDESALREVLSEAGHEYWQRYLGAMVTMKGRYPAFAFKDPVVENQGGVKFALFPLPPEERAVALRFIRSRLSEQGREILAGRYQVKAGGKSTIDVFPGRLNKAFAIRDILDELGIPFGEEYPLVYFGDGFYLRPDQFGEIHTGEDMSVLEVPNVVPIAVNRDQEDLSTLPPRIIAGGSGPEATLTWLSFINNQLGT